MSSSAKVASGWARESARPAPAALTQTGVVTAIYCALCALSLFPFLWFSEPPITDFANHAARLSIACNRADPAFAAMYRYGFGIIPNLAIDAFNLPLCGLVQPSMVLRLVTAGSLVAIYAFGWMIQRRLFGRPNAFLFLAPAIAFNIVTLMGYINYLAGVGIVCAMVAFAVGRERSFRSLLALCNLGGLALFFCHIYALGFGMMVFFGLMLGREPLSIAGFVRAGLRTLSLFAAPIALMGFVPSSEHGLHVGYGDKLRAFPPLIMSKTFDMRVCGIALIAAIYIGVRNKLVRIHPALRSSLAIVGAFVLFGPNQVQEGFDLDVRILVALAYLAFAALEPLKQELKTTAIVLAASLFSIALQYWAVVTIWQPFSRQVDEFRSASMVLPATARVLPVVDLGPKFIAWPTAYIHLTSYATADEHVFNPLDFTGVGMQPLSPTAAYAPIDPGVGAMLYSADANKLANPTRRTETAVSRYRPYSFALRWPQRFDYVVHYHFGRARNFNPAVLTPIRQGSFFTIYKINRDGAPQPAARF